MAALHESCVQVGFLLHALQGAAGAAALDGALQAMPKLAEDCSDAVLAPLQPAQSPDCLADALMPHIAALFGSAQYRDVWLEALQALNALAGLLPPWLERNGDGYAAGLLALAVAGDGGWPLVRVRCGLRNACSDAVLEPCCTESCLLLNVRQHKA
jgi:hypothetical protein